MLKIIIRHARLATGIWQTPDSPAEPALPALKDWLWNRYRLQLTKEQLSSVRTLSDLDDAAVEELARSRKKLWGIVYAEVFHVLNRMPYEKRRRIPTSLMEDVVCRLLDPAYLLRLPDTSDPELFSASQEILRSIFARYFHPERNTLTPYFGEIMDKHPITDDIPDQPGRWPNRLWFLTLETNTKVYAVLRHRDSDRSASRAYCLVRENAAAELLGEPIQFLNFDLDDSGKIQGIHCVMTNERAPLTYDQKFLDDNNQWYTETVTEKPFRETYLRVGSGNTLSSSDYIGLFDVSFSRRYTLSPL